MEQLLSAWPEVARRLQRARRILLLTDYDGTLTPIVERPELAHLPESTRMLLKALRYQPRFKVGVISGRALSDLKGRVGIHGIIYAGNHGLEIEGPGISFVNPIAEEMKPVLRVIHQVLKRALGGSRGVLVEDKGLTQAELGPEALGLARESIQPKTHQPRGRMAHPQRLLGQGLLGGADEHQASHRLHH